MVRLEVSKNVVKWSKGLTNRMSIIIRRYEYLDETKFAAYVVVSFVTFFKFFWSYFCVILYMAVCFVCFCLILQIMYSYC